VYSLLIYKEKKLISSLCTLTKNISFLEEINSGTPLGPLLFTLKHKKNFAHSELSGRK